MAPRLTENEALAGRDRSKKNRWTLQDAVKAMRADFCAAGVNPETNYTLGDGPGYILQIHYSSVLSEVQFILGGHWQAAAEAMAYLKSSKTVAGHKSVLALKYVSPGGKIDEEIASLLSACNAQHLLDPRGEEAIEEPQAVSWSASKNAARAAAPKSEANDGDTVKAADDTKSKKHHRKFKALLKSNKEAVDDKLKKHREEIEALLESRLEAFEAKDVDTDDDEHGYDEDSSASSSDYEAFNEEDHDDYSAASGNKRSRSSTPEDDEKKALKTPRKTTRKGP